MAICASCRLALRRTLTTTPKHTTTRTLTTGSSSTAASILEKPTWSVRSLLPSSPSSAPKETISSSQLHHLLRLSALPLPPTPADEAAMIDTLQSQLQFVRAVQRVDTTGVEPLRAIRDETLAAQDELTIGLEDLKEALDKEVLVGHYQRARRVKNKIDSEAEKWDALGTAGRTAGRYFVVESGKKEVEGIE
ncbi:a-agglutinin core AGA1 [Fusarium albosuccineum]|uniref:A-agglutinin core AGA1 n=1 Tax=Fusarium albosuccineum TaxID=1237068 RepID=A0A8H4LMI9_9HYPO|nr:a-agglutinin core AGA1 [Fusarium albosuccineum]